MRHLLLIAGFVATISGCSPFLSGQNINPFTGAITPIEPQLHEAKCGDEWRTSSHLVDRALLRVEELDEKDGPNAGPYAIGGDSLRSLGEFFWKREMQKAVTQLRNKMPASKQVLLDRAQQAWSRYAEAHLEVRYYVLDPDNETLPIMTLTPLAQARRCRALELQATYAELTRQ